MDIATLAKTYTAEGPFVSLYLDATSAVEDAAARFETRWKNVQRDLADAGVDEATREALDAARGQHGGGNTRVLIASHGQVHLAAWLDEPPPQDVVLVGALPHLLPLVDSLSLRVPHVVALTDREGADVLAYTGGSEPVEQASVQTDLWPIHRTGTGGWSVRRYDATVHENWRENAREVAALLEKVARDVDARLVIGCGDEQTLSLLADALPTALAEVLVRVPGGGRAQDGSSETVAAEVARAVADRVAADTLDLLDRFSQERGRDERASDGVGATVEALRRAQVDTLLLTDAFEGGAEPAWFGPEPTQLALSRQPLDDLGVSGIEQAPLADVLLRAALCTGATVRMVTGGTDQSPGEGVGALLRYSD